MFLSSLLFGIFIINLEPFLNIWDERFHALVAKNLSQNPLTPTLFSNPILDYNFKDWTSNNIWLHKQPFFLWLISISIKIFGNTLFALRFPSLILHAFLPLLLFRISILFKMKRAGLIASIILSNMYFLLALMSGKINTDHNDLIFLVLITSSIWAYIEYTKNSSYKWIILIGLFAGLAVMTKWLTGLLVFGGWLCAILASKNKSEFIHFLISLLMAFIVFLPWQIYVALSFPLEAAYENTFNATHFTKAIENHSGDFSFHFNMINQIYGNGDLVKLLIGISFILLVSMIKEKSYKIFLLAIILFVYGFFSLAKTKMPAYAVIVMPYLLLGFGILIDQLFVQVEKKIRKRIVGVFFYCSVVLISFLFFDLGRISNYYTFWKPKDNKERIKNIMEMKLIEGMKKYDSKSTVIFNFSLTPFGNISYMFFNEGIAYPVIPSEEQVRMLKKKGFKIFILETKILPSWLKLDRDIKKIRCNEDF